MLLNRSGLRASVVSAMLALSVAIPVAAQNVAKVSAAPRIRIDNFGKINATYYRGAQPQGHDYADLAALGVKTVIDLTDDDGEASEPSMARSAGMQSIKIPMNGHVPPTSAQLAQFMKIVNDPASQPVYVHCVGGKHRTGVMTAAYRMVHDGWTSDKAFGNEAIQVRNGHAASGVQTLRLQLQAGTEGFGADGRRVDHPAVIIAASRT